MPISLPAQIDEILTRLKLLIRRYVLIRGFSLVIAVLIGLFWFSLGIDAIWFSLTRLELSQSFRLFVLVAGCCLVIGLLMQTVIWQLFVVMRRRALALLLERKFPELNDRLITVVEVAEQYERYQAPTEPSPLTRTMLERTLADTCRVMENLKLVDVFNPKPLQRALVLACVAIGSVAATALASPETISHWSAAYLHLHEEYWNRENGLTVKVLAQPGDRLRLFEERVCKHAAGSDLTLLVETANGKQPPLQVLLTYRTSTGARGKALMTPAGTGRFRHTIGNLIDDLEFYLTGGDYTTAQPYRIETVPEPQISSMVADCTYPAYTGWNDPGSLQPRSLTISSAELLLPMETEFFLQATSTKPLNAMQISGQNFEWKLTRNPTDGKVSAQYRLLDEQGLVISQVEVASTDKLLLDETGLKLTIPLQITLASPTVSVEQAASGTILSAISLREAESLRLFLEDTDGIINLEPIRLNIVGQPDLPPVVQCRLAGIGKAITRKAIVPVRGLITDDYGLATLQFDYRLSADGEARQLPLKRQPAGTREYRMEKATETPLEVFDVLPLELKVDDVLFLAVLATDKDNINGPHQSRSETYRLKIVSDEELLSLLYQDELNLRRRFEQVIEEITRARDDLQTSVATATADPTAAAADSVQRMLNIIQKDVVESDAIRAAFVSIFEELVNNRIDTPQIRNRLQDKIITPFEQVIADEFEVAEENLSQLDFANRRGTMTQVTANQCLQDVDRLLASLSEILLEMRKLESFQEVIELLKGIIDDEKALKEQTEQERKKKLIDLLN